LGRWEAISSAGQYSTPSSRDRELGGAAPGSRVPACAPRRHRRERRPRRSAQPAGCDVEDATADNGVARRKDRREMLFIGFPHSLQSPSSWQRCACHHAYALQGCVSVQTLIGARWVPCEGKSAVPTASHVRSGSRVASVAMRAEAAEGQALIKSRRDPAHHPLIHKSGVATLLVDRSVAAVTDVADCIVIRQNDERLRRSPAGDDRRASRTRRIRPTGRRSWWWVRGQQSNEDRQMWVTIDRSAGRGRTSEMPPTSDELAKRRNYSSASVAVLIVGFKAAQRSAWREPVGDPADRRAPMGTACRQFYRRYSRPS
jgi:hypothetical protein